jgi:hypothetical protein
MYRQIQRVEIAVYMYIHAYSTKQISAGLNGGSASRLPTARRGLVGLGPR